MVMVASVPGVVEQPGGSVLELPLMAATYVALFDDLNLGGALARAFVVWSVATRGDDLWSVTAASNVEGLSS